MDSSNFIQDIGRSFIVSAFIPASIFILVISILLIGTFPYPKYADENSVGTAIIYIFIFSVVGGWLAYALYSSSRSIIRIYEGYHFPRWIRIPLTYYQKRWHRKQAKTAKQYQKFVQGEDIQFEEKTGDARQRALVEFHILETQAPVEEKSLLPTRFGNVLRASEMYPTSRYNLDGITIWPRLFRVLPAKFVNDMEEKNNQMMFLINSSFLAYLCGLLAIVLAGYQFLSQRCGQINSCQFALAEVISIGDEIISINTTGYLVVGIGLLLLGYLMYLSSIQAAVKFGGYIKSGYDLYRLDLIKELNLRLPADSLSEKILWRKISELFMAGDRLEKQPVLDHYVLRSDLKQDLPQEKTFLQKIFSCLGSG